MFWAPIKTFDPAADSTAVCRSINGGQTTISSRVCAATIGRKSLTKAAVSAGVLYIFQLPAIIFFLMNARPHMSSSMDEDVISKTDYRPRHADNQLTGHLE